MKATPLSFVSLNPDSFVLPQRIIDNACITSQKLAHIYIEDYMTFFFEKQLSKVRMNIFLNNN